MHYMMDIETHTVIYLRDLLATRAANDPQVTAFLACWVYEELWHGEAFSDFLRAYGIEVPAEPKLPDGRTPMPTRAERTSSCASSWASATGSRCCRRCSARWRCATSSPCT